MINENNEISIANEKYIRWRYILDIFALATLFNIVINLLQPIIANKLPQTSNSIINTAIICASTLPFAFIAAYLSCTIAAKDILKKKNILKSYIPNIIKFVSIYILIAGLLYATVKTSESITNYKNLVYNNPEYIKQSTAIHNTKNQDLINLFESSINKSIKENQLILATCVFTSKIIETIFYLISIKLSEKIFLKAAYDDNLVEKNSAITKYA